MAVTTRSRRPKDLYEDWAGSLDTLWSIQTWNNLQEAKQQKTKNKQKKKSSEINIPITPSVVHDDKFTAMGNSVDIAVDRITTLENRISAVEAELHHKPKKRKIKIKIRG